MPSRHHRRFLLLVLSAVVALTVAACGGEDDEPTRATTGANAAAGAFPATIDHAFGSTTVEQAPERVVAIGWSDQDVALALGVTPVAVAKTIDEFPDGVGPWAQPQLDGATPEVLDVTTDGVPFERVAALRPDLILAVQSGIDEGDYERLAQIAPTVAYQEGRAPYLTPWQEQTEVIAAALGQPERGAQLVEEVEAEIAAATEDHPELAGTTFAYTGAPGNGQLPLYIGDDPRVQLIEALGMELLPDVAALGDGESFYETVSFERASIVDGDVLIGWFYDDAEADAFASNPLIRDLDVVRDGGFVPLDIVLAQAQGAPTVLSIPWALERLVPKLADAAGGAAE